jgi:hypothetical protein
VVLLTWSLDSINKLDPALIAKQSLQNLSFHPPYVKDDITYLQFGFSPQYHPYIYKGSHINSKYHTAIFKLAESYDKPVTYAFDVEEAWEAQCHAIIIQNHNLCKGFPSS